MPAEVAYDSRVTKFAPAELAHPLYVAPDVEGRVEVLGCAFDLFLDEVGLELQSMVAVHEVSSLDDAVADDLHVIVGGQGDLILHGVHQRFSLVSWE